jgi:hypothetical protein
MGKKRKKIGKGIISPRRPVTDSGQNGPSDRHRA